MAFKNSPQTEDNVSGINFPAFQEMKQSLPDPNPRCIAGFPRKYRWECENCGGSAEGKASTPDEISEAFIVWSYAHIHCPAAARKIIYNDFIPEGKQCKTVS